MLLSVSLRTLLLIVVQRLDLRLSSLDRASSCYLGKLCIP